MSSVVTRGKERGAERDGRGARKTGRKEGKKRGMWEREGDGSRVVLGH